MEILTEANIQYINNYWKLRKEAVDKKAENEWIENDECDLYDTLYDTYNQEIFVEDTETQNYIEYLDDEYQKYIEKIGLDMDDRTYDENLWMFIHAGKTLDEY